MKFFFNKKLQTRNELFYICTIMDAQNHQAMTIPAIWNFCKKYWFHMALAILIVLALLRYFGGWSAVSTRSPIFTAEPATASGDAALLGVLATPEQPVSAMPAIGEDAALAFFQRFARVAVSERKKYGVPAAVTLAYAFVNSQAGKRTPAIKANNYFALPCTSDWEGDTFENDGACFRRYETAWESFRDFSVFMSSREWYGEVRKQSGKDWRGWVKALERSGAPGVAGGAKAMQHVIEQYGLDELDR